MTTAVTCCESTAVGMSIPPVATSVVVVVVEPAMGGPAACTVRVGIVVATVGGQSGKVNDGGSFGFTQRPGAGMVAGTTAGAGAVVPACCAATVNTGGTETAVDGMAGTELELLDDELVPVADAPDAATAIKVQPRRMDRVTIRMRSLSGVEDLVSGASCSAVRGRVM